MSIISRFSWKTWNFIFDKLFARSIYSQNRTSDRSTRCFIDIYSSDCATSNIALALVN